MVGLGGFLPLVWLSFVFLYEGIKEFKEIFGSLCLPGLEFGVYL